MAQVISATTKFGAGASVSAGKGEAKRQRFLVQAADLLEQARAYVSEGRYENAVEVAYQAALRTAGARVAVSRVAQRKRKPSSAWEQLALVNAEGKDWAREFVSYSRLRSRLVSGLEDGVEESLALDLMALVARFLEDTEYGSVLGGAAA